MLRNLRSKNKHNFWLFTFKKNSKYTYDKFNLIDDIGNESFQINIILLLIGQSLINGKIVEALPINNQCILRATCSLISGAVICVLGICESTSSLLKLISKLIIKRKWIR